MNKIFTLLFAAMVGTTAFAQTLTVHKTDGTSVSFNANEVKNVVFTPAQVAPPTNDTTLIRGIDGYITVSTLYFKDKYFSGNAHMEVFRVKKEMFCRFTHPQWGEGKFSIGMNQGHVSGKGTLTLVGEDGVATTHNATLSGSMTDLTISILDFMGDTEIHWKNGEAPIEIQISGQYQGINDYELMGQHFKDEDAVFTVTVNADGTVNLVSGEQILPGTPMGNLTLGSYTIPNLTYDKALNAYKRTYTVEDGLKVQVKPMGKDYPMKGEAVVTLNSNGKLMVQQKLQLGSMPFELSATYSGERITEKIGD